MKILFLFRKIRRLWFFPTALLVLLSSSPVEAQTPLFTPINAESTLQDLLLYAQREAPELRAAYDLWQADRSLSLQALAIPNPKIGYTRFVEAIETRVGPIKDQWSVSQSIPWPLYWYFNWSASKKKASVSEQRYVAKRLAVVERIKNAYYEYYYLNKAIQITSENLDLIQYLEKIAGARYSTARGSHTNFIKAQVELGKLEDRVNTLKDFEITIQAEINAILNRPSQSPLPSPKEIQWRKVPLKREWLNARLEENNPELIALDFEVLKARDEKKRAFQAYFPNLSVFSSYSVVDPAVPNPVSGFVPADSGKDAFTLGGGLEVPLWFFKNYAAHEEARLRQSAAQNQKLALENYLRKHLEKTYFKVRDAERKIDLYKTVLIPKAEEALKSAITAFSSGKVDFVSLIDSERTALEFSLIYERSLADYLQGLAQSELMISSEFSQLDFEKEQPGGIQ